MQAAICTAAILTVAGLLAETALGGHDWPGSASRSPSAGVEAGAFGASAPDASPGRWTAADYWAYADRRQAEVEPLWSSASGLYRIVLGAQDLRLNANQLAVHAAAALAGHRGLARQDARVAAISAVLVRFPAFSSDPAQLDPRNHDAHVPGWGESSRQFTGQHVAVDAQIAESLALAHQARVAAGVPADLSQTIDDRVRSVARSRFFRYPAIHRNQFNWNADLYRADADITGEPVLLARDYRAQVRRFVRRARPSGGHAGYLNRGLGLNYAPRGRQSAPSNRVGAAEYDNLVFSGLRHYEPALARGMSPLTRREEDTLRAWARRVMFGDWTHGGDLNWDTGLGLERFQLARYWAFAGRGLLTLATQRRLAGHRAQPAWAKWLLDRHLAAYERRAARSGGGLLRAMPFGLHSPFADWSNDPYLTAARFSATAARAALGLGAATGRPPPAYFAHDPDIHRLAVSTPFYNTAIVPPNRTGYGGLELARLYDAAQEPLTGTGGAGRAALGLELRRRGRLVLDTQPRYHAALPGVRGWRVRNRARRGDPLRGTFSRLTAAGTLRNRAGDRVRVVHRFTPGRISTTRTVRSRRGAGVVVRLPRWEHASARVRRTRRGLVVRVRSARAGYTALVRGLPRRVRVRGGVTGAQASAPGVRWTTLISFRVRPRRTVAVTVTLVPDRT